MTHTRFSAAFAVAIVVAAAAATHGLAQDKGNAPPPAAGAAQAQPPKAADAAGVPAALCPVTGKPIDRSIFVEFRDKKVYFADADAKKKFQDNKDPYLEAVKKQWEALRPLRVQVKCPVTLKPVNPEICFESGGATVCFATAEARDQWKKDSKPFEKNLAEQCYSFQTNCLVCNHDIDGTMSIEVDGRTVYLGCNGCAEEIRSDKVAYLKKLDTQMAANKAAWEKQAAAKK